MKYCRTSLKQILLPLCLLLGPAVFAQKIVYSEPKEDESRRMNFEVIGKVSGNFLVYKSLRNRNYISVYDNEMKETGRSEQDYIPNDRLINVDFFAYPDFSYVVYQYQKKNVVYCNAVKVDGNGKKVSDVITLDTSHISFTSSNRIYSAISSENKNHILVFKINSRNKSRFLITTVLFDRDLNLLKRSRFVMPMEESNDYLDKFTLDNEGDLVFAKFNRLTSENINNTYLTWKPAMADTVTTIAVPQDKYLLDELQIKVDNFNNRYFLTSFYYEKKRGNIEGFFFYVWDKKTRQPVMQNAVALGEDLRNEARGDQTSRMAFNDFFVRNVVIKKSGGFIINTESYYTTSRNSSWNRWNYLYGSPWSSYDYYNYYYSPYRGTMGYRDRYSSYQNVRMHSDNILVLSFTPTGQLEWSNVIHKEQFDDESDDRLSYVMANTGNQVHYLFNVDEKRAQLLLNDFTLTADGKVAHNPTLKNLERGYEFLTKYGKQVSASQVIVPCNYRNYICFAKIEFN